MDDRIGAHTLTGLIVGELIAVLIGDILLQFVLPAFGKSRVLKDAFEDELTPVALYLGLPTESLGERIGLIGEVFTLILKFLDDVSKGMTLFGLGLVGLCHLLLERLYLLLQRREDDLEVLFLLLCDLVALLLDDLLCYEAELLTQLFSLLLLRFGQFGQLPTKPLTLLTHGRNSYSSILGLLLTLLQSRA